MTTTEGASPRALARRAASLAPRSLQGGFWVLSRARLNAKSAPDECNRNRKRRRGHAGLSRKFKKLSLRSSPRY
jgi:hypothetical protein